MALLDDILAKFKTKPPSKIWLPIFYEARRQKKKGDLDLNTLISEKLAELKHSTKGVENA